MESIELLKEPLDIFNNEELTSSIMKVKVNYGDLQIYLNDIKVGIEITEVFSSKLIEGVAVGSIIYISLYNKTNLFQ